MQISIQTISIRYRIFLISIFPFIIFILLGFAYSYEENTTRTLQASQKTDSAIARHAETLNAKAWAIAAFGKQFLLHPDQQSQDRLINEVQDAHRHLEALRHLSLTDAQAALDSGLSLLDETQSDFDRIVSNSKIMGWTADSGLMRDLPNATEQVETLLEADLFNGLSRLAILRIVGEIRRLEKSYLLSRDDRLLGAWEANLNKFEEALANSRVAEKTAAAIVPLVVDYRAKVLRWIALSNEQGLLNQAIEAKLERLTGWASRLSVTAAQAVEQSSERNSIARRQSQTLILVLMGGATLATLLLGIIVARSVTKPLAIIIAAIGDLAAGRTALVLPGSGGDNEIASIARALVAFRDTALERNHLAEEQRELSERRTRRARDIEGLIGSFEQHVKAVVRTVGLAIEKLEENAHHVRLAASDVDTAAKIAGESANTTSSSIQSVTHATSDLLLSIDRIGQESLHSTRVADDAVDHAEVAKRAIKALEGKALHINNIIATIEAFAARSNLLALNATIEAARAGTAGIGFAVVAKEVKSLSGQIARATGEITDSINTIQDMTAETNEAINNVDTIIKDMFDRSNIVASAVKEQTESVRSIADSMAGNSMDVQSGAAAIHQLAHAAHDAHAAAQQMSELAAALSQDSTNLHDAVGDFLNGVREA